MSSAAVDSLLPTHGESPEARAHFSVPQPTPVPAGFATSSFHDWFVGANVDRQLGRHAQVGFSYAVQEQSSPAVCPVASCGGTGFQQSFGMTVNWHLLH